MRTALVSLIAAAGLAGVAYAQDTAAPAPAPAPAAPAPAAAPAAAPAVTPAPAPPVAVAPVEAAAPPPPTLPTTGDGAMIISVLEKVCVPAVHGGAKLDDLAKAAGFKANRREGTWVMAMGADRNYSITLLAQGSNKDVCQAEVHYALGQEAPIVSAINIWSFLHQPELILQANYVAVDPDGVKRVRKSWENLGSNTSTAVNFSTERKPDDTSLNARYDTGKLFYQERSF